MFKIRQQKINNFEQDIDCISQYFSALQRLKSFRKSHTKLVNLNSN